MHALALLYQHVLSSSIPTSKLTCVSVFIISDVQVEDSAVIECAAGKPSMRKATQTLAICGQYLMLNCFLLILHYMYAFMVISLQCIKVIIFCT